MKWKSDWRTDKERSGDVKRVQEPEEENNERREMGMNRGINGEER
jgi:hypothetical protein